MFDQYNNVEHNAGSIVGLDVPYADAQFYSFVVCHIKTAVTQY